MQHIRERKLVQYDCMVNHSPIYKNILVGADKYIPILHTLVDLFISEEGLKNLLGKLVLVSDGSNYNTNYVIPPIRCYSKHKVLIAQ